MPTLPLPALALAATFAAVQPTLPAGLDAGPHRVGFRVLTVEDSSRITGGRVAADKRTSPRSRTLRLHVWYPAADDGAALSIASYLEAASLPAAQHRQDIARLTTMALSDEEWAAYLKYPVTAKRDATAAPGRFPLIVGMLRAVSVAVTAEHLASHGYVVAYVERQPRESILAEGLVREGLVLQEYVRDMEVAIARLRQDPNVDAARLGAQGFSGDGLAQMVLSMRHPDVDAVSLFESGWLSPAQVSSFQEMRSYDPLAMRSALFYAYSENLGRNSLEHVAELKGMRYGHRALMYLGEPTLTHLDFATEGLVLTEQLARRQSTRGALVTMMQAAFRYQRIFFDAHVKDDPAARAKLSEVPVPRTGGALIELTELPAIAPALSRAELQAGVEADLPAALARARADLARDPRAAVFDATWLNAFAYGYFQRGQRERAAALMQLAVEAHPRSANLLDSLSEMLEALGQRTEALSAAERALAALPTDKTVPPNQRAALEAGLKARVGRLKGTVA